jgi:hypothetical protein
MVVSTASNQNRATFPPSHRDPYLAALLRGDVLLETRAHSAWGAGVTAQIYLPIARETVWNQLTDYPRWVQYFPDITQSRILESTNLSDRNLGERIDRNSGNSNLSNRKHLGEVKRLYQAANKTFLFLTAQAEIYLRVFETAYQQIQFCLESGSFHDFLADLRLKDFADGTVLVYSVQATPTIPIPSAFIQQAIQLDLPNNLRKMRQVLCN